jgi:hypothetical protein
LVRQLIDSDSQPETLITDVKPDITKIKIENNDDDDIALLNQIKLNESFKATEMSDFKTKDFGPADGTSNQTANITSDYDFQSHLKNQKNSSKLLFYWIDAYEDPMNSNGTVFLFGKTPILKQQQQQQQDVKKVETKEEPCDGNDKMTFVSVCCIIKNVPRLVHVLPRKYKKNTNEPVTMDDVTLEIDRVMEKFKIYSYRTKV